MSSSPREFAIQVVRQLQSAGFEGLWAGGCVRDQLLGIEPKDYDVATSATPQQIRELFGFKKTIPIGAAFGVITVIGPKSAGNIEVATFRNDGQYTDGRHPDSVEFSTAEMDAQRRDFTINGLFFNPINNAIVDFVGGQDDLKVGIVRAIGSPLKRFQEDKLRLLRAVRFAATYQLEIEPSTASSIRELADALSVVSRERIGGEVRRMLQHPSRRIAVETLFDLGLYRSIFPVDCLTLMKEKSVPNNRTFDVLENIDVRCRLFTVGAAALLHEVFEEVGDRNTESAKTLKAVLDNWKLSNDEASTISWILANYKTLAHSVDEPWSRIQRLLIQPDAAAALDLLDALLRSEVLISDTLQPSIDFCRQKLSLPIAQLDPPVLLDGADLKELQLSPGPEFKQILEQVRTAQLMEQIRTPVEASELALKIAAGLSLKKKA